MCPELKVLLCIIHSFICSICIYGAPVTCLAVKILLFIHSFIHSSLCHAYIECLLFAKHGPLSQATGNVAVRVSDFTELGFAFCNSLSRLTPGPRGQPVERGCCFHSHFTNQRREGQSSLAICPRSAESKLESGFPTPNARLYFQ